jgi:uncharacterized protein
MMQGATPIQPSRRIAALDALRGLALFGVLAINLETEFRVSIFQQFLPRAHELGVERQIDAFLTIFIDLKAFAVFSLLFGAGLAIQHEHLAGNPRRAVMLVRRLAALLLFGLIHLLFIWNGDILTEYAIAGFVVLPFLFAPSWMLVAGAVVFLTLYLVLPLVPFVPFPGTALLAAHVAEAGRVYHSGNVPAMLSFSWSELPLLLPLHIYIFPRTVGLFLLGAASWRLGVIRWNSRALLCAALPAIAIGLVLALSTDARWYSGWPWPGGIGPAAADASNTLLGLGYCALVLCAYADGAGRLLSWAEPVGRMAFTNYILQSLILTSIFYGFGLFGMLDLETGLALTLLIYAGQVLASRAWLAHFRFGPLEWLWRAMMYGHPPEFRRAPAAA